MLKQIRFQKTVIPAKESLPVRLCLIRIQKNAWKYKYTTKKYTWYFCIGSPSQTADKFGSFIINLEKLLANIFIRNPYFVFITRDFKA